MEPWNYVSEGKGFESDETLSRTNSHTRNKKASLDWELRAAFSFGNNLLVSGEQAVETQGFGQLGFPEMIGKQVADNSISEVLSSQVAGGRDVNPLMGMPNAFSAEDDSTSMLSSSVIDSHSRDSSFIDLKLGRLPDHPVAPNSKFSNGISVLSSSESSTPTKRVKTSGVNTQIAFCQVYGCNKDLTSSKDYHKRHKVCEVHSKTAKVIVNGIEQRFCQQCSRFHLLPEFDDGKRSCRKRLAGHNERRRKPQMGIHSGRGGRSLQSYAGLASSSRYEGSPLSPASFICQEILPSGRLHPEKYGASDWSRHIKVEGGNDYRPLSTIHATNRQLHSKLLFPQDMGKQFAPFHDNGANTATGNIFTENITQYSHDIGGPTSSTPSGFHNTSIGRGEFNVFHGAPTIQGLSGISDSGCALSLLSSQSQNSSSHSSGIPMARPLIMPSSHPHYGMGPASEKFLGISSQPSCDGVSNTYPSQEMHSAEENHLGRILISDSGDAVNFEMGQGIFQGSDVLNSNDHHSCENGPTIDLLRLSSQLQRVEHERQSMKVKQDNDAFCCLRIT